MAQIIIGIQSLQDAVAGRPVLEDLRNLPLVESARPLHVGILEGGTTSGQTSLSFTIFAADGTAHMAQVTGKLFESLYQAYQGAQARFEHESRTRQN